MKNIHFQIRVVLNEDKYVWNKPKVDEDIEFTIPFDMFTPTQLGDMVNGKVLEMNEKYPLAIEEWEREREAEEARVWLEEKEIEENIEE